LSYVCIYLYALSFPFVFLQLFWSVIDKWKLNIFKLYSVILRKIPIKLTNISIPSHNFYVCVYVRTLMIYSLRKIQIYINCNYIVCITSPEFTNLITKSFHLELIATHSPWKPLSTLCFHEFDFCRLVTSCTVFFCVWLISFWIMSSPSSFAIEVYKFYYRQLLM
jgi:hypothetical protein